MKFDPAKSYPHPVLRPTSRDYPYAEFQVEIVLERLPNTTATRARADFALSDPDLLRLVTDGRADYVLLVRCPTTHLRVVTRSSETIIDREFPPGLLSGRTEFCSFLVATDDLTQFQANGWHQDFSTHAPFDVSAGSVLAADYPKEYWIDTAPESPLGSIFELDVGNNCSDGQWSCDLSEQRVRILMSKNAFDRFALARANLNGKQAQAYIMNAVYLPALLHVLSTADMAPEDYSEQRWFRSLDAKLEELGRPRLGAGGTNRLSDAQHLLESPFGQLPFQLAADDGSDA